MTCDIKWDKIFQWEYIDSHCCIAVFASDYDGKTNIIIISLSGAEEVPVQARHQSPDGNQAVPEELRNPHSEGVFRAAGVRADPEEGGIQVSSAPLINSRINKQKRKW